MSVFIWKKVKPGQLWHCLDLDDKLVGFVRFNFDGWDAYVTTDKKWPEAERCVTGRYLKRLFWPMRRRVEGALEDAATQQHNYEVRTCEVRG